MIRRYEEKDTDSIVAVWRGSSEFAHPFLKKDFLDSEAIALRDVYLKFAETWVTEIDGNIVGFISLAENEIAGLFLNPHFHRQGLGKAMVDKALSLKGALTVEVFENNVIGREFYDAFGFTAFDQTVHKPTGQTVIKMTFKP